MEGGVEEGCSTPGTLRVELETRGPVSLSDAPVFSLLLFLFLLLPSTSFCLLLCVSEMEGRAGGVVHVVVVGWWWSSQLPSHQRHTKTLKHKHT